jgi:hypothetical protein
MVSAWFMRASTSCGAADCVCISACAAAPDAASEIRQIGSNNLKQPVTRNAVEDCGVCMMEKKTAEALWERFCRS